jgi:hypothetical protein
MALWGRAGTRWEPPALRCSRVPAAHACPARPLEADVRHVRMTPLPCLAGPRALLVRNRDAAWTSQMQDFVALEPRLSTPAPEVFAREVEGVSELDKHVERHQQAERILPPRIINEVLDCDEGPVVRQRLVGEPSEMFFPLQVPVMDRIRGSKPSPHGRLIHPNASRIQGTGAAPSCEVALCRPASAAGRHINCEAAIIAGPPD